jgi:PAS domain S-box-containing protein
MEQSSLIDELSEQLGAVIDGGFARRVKLDAEAPGARVLEQRINAVIEAAEARGGEVHAAAQAAAERHTKELGWVLDSIVENAPTMLFLKRAEDLVVEIWNKQAERLTGVKAADLIGKAGFGLFPAEEMEAFQRYDREALAGKRLVATEETITGPDGTPRWFYSKKIPLLDEHGEPRHLLGISEEITERKRATEELRLAKEAAEAMHKAKTDFLANVSHELRTPLTLILGPVEDSLADAEQPLPPRQRERQEVLQRNALRLLKLVNTLLDFSRLEAGRLQASFEALDLAALTVDLASGFRAAIERAGLRLLVNADPSPDDVYVDRDMWEKITLNLLSNALKFTFDGEIEVSLRTTSRCVVLAVRDTGTGIAPDERPRVFERFHRVRGARSRTHEGTGIGLALVRELVHLHGGTIAVESEVGRGTTFTVTIPRGIAHLPPEHVRAARALTTTAIGAKPFVEEALRWLPSAPAVSGVIAREKLDRTARRARILVADDNADMRSYLANLLGVAWDVTTVADGAEALREVGRDPPDLVLSDVMMPGIDGFQLLRALRDDARTRTIPMILLSARAGEEATVEGLQVGADDYLVKPFSARELVARVQAALWLAQLRREQDARAAAEEANKLKDEFLATLSHELRTPLCSIMGWAAILNQAPPGAATLAKGLDIIARNAQAQKTIIEDILDMSRIVTGRLRIETAPVDLDKVVKEAIDVVRPTAAAKAISVRYLSGGEPFRLSGDPLRLAQVVWNLLSNAVKFTPRGGRVDVALKRAGAAAELRITDSGEGIPPALLPYIFDRFRQADGSTTRRYGGLGLGLAIVRQLVELHGGEVHAESAGRGQGATFTVRLPIPAVDDPQPRPADPTPAQAQIPAADPRARRSDVWARGPEPVPRVAVQARSGLTCGSGSAATPRAR